MPSTPQTRQGRVFKSLSMGQDPKDRLWAAIYALILLVIVVGMTSFLGNEQTQDTLSESRTQGFERGAVVCLTVVVDDDRAFAPPTYCKRPEVTAYYPPEVCAEFFDQSAACSEKWEEE